MVRQGLWPKGGKNAAYVDAFCATTGRFIPDDFVALISPGKGPSVSPMSTESANKDGVIATGGFGKSVFVTAKEVIDSTPTRSGGKKTYRFSHWQLLVSHGGDQKWLGTSAAVDTSGINCHQRLVLHKDNRVKAIAVYDLVPARRAIRKL